ncbi:MAG: class I SAM-dependent methyltransferase [Nocardioidaceae bacterium]
MVDELLECWRAEEQVPFEGWDFSHLEGRWHEDSPPWSYLDLARATVGGASSVLDMGTGGGEVLAELADVLPADVVATEGWAPNVPVARRNLAQLGVSVVEYDAEGSQPQMPFPDGRFDVVLNRHEAYVATEVARVLRPGGVLFTQQVDGHDFPEARELFGGEVQNPHVTLVHLSDDARRAGLSVERSADWSGQSTFDDVGALVYYFTVVSWDVPDDFGVDAYADTLLALHEGGPARGRRISFTMKRFSLLARKPGDLSDAS